MALPMPPPPAPRPASPPDRAPSPVDRRELRPRRWWYWLAGALLTVGVLGGVVIGAQAVVGLIQLDDLDRFTTGESFDVALSPDEPTSIYVRQDDQSTLPVVECEGTGPAGATIELTETDLAASVLFEGDFWVAGHDVDVSRPATYTIECRDFAGTAELHLGIGRRADPMSALGRYRGRGLMFTAATAAGIVIGLVVGIRRSGHKRRLTAERRPAAAPAVAPTAGPVLTALQSPPMDIRLDGKVALVTGASRGIGEAIAQTFAAAGAAVMLSSRKQEALEETASTIDGDVAVYAANAGEPDQAQACVEATKERFGAVDILVNNAATNPYFGPAIAVDLPRYDKTMQVNLRGPLVWTQAAWESSMKDNGGVVLNMASVGGLVTEPVLGIYNVTKAGLIHLTRTLALDMAPGVRVNALAPGVVKTDFARALWEPAGDQLAKALPLGRIGLPEDIANAALFLCSDAASWITGQVLVIDGGSMIRPSVN